MSSYLATAISAMSEYDEVDKMCLKFEIQLYDNDDDTHSDIAYRIYHICDMAYSVRNKSFNNLVSGIGVIYFGSDQKEVCDDLDEGNSGEDIYRSHGYIFLPKDTSEEMLKSVIGSIEPYVGHHPSIKSKYGRRASMRNTDDSIKVEKFDWKDDSHTILDCILFGLTMGRENLDDPNLTIMMPFNDYLPGSPERRLLQDRRDTVLEVLKSDASFKVVAGLKGGIAQGC